MFSITERSSINESDRRFKIGLILLNLDNEYTLNENGVRSLDSNSTISAIVNAVKPKSFEARFITENITELRFIIDSERSTQNIQNDVRSLGSSVGTQQIDLSNITVDELP